VQQNRETVCSASESEATKKVSETESKDRAEVRVFPPGVPVATILIGIGLDRFFPLRLGLPAPTRFWLGGAVVVAAVLGLGLWSVVLFRRSGQNENPWKPTPEIVDRGPFRVTRNPMYLQMVLGCIGFATILSNAWILLLTPACGAALQRFVILPEEAYLERKFGDAYLNYKRRVRRWV
jgi:protein-S-isoprenylcysteine O-methyltransferase Ste14